MKRRTVSRVATATVVLLALGACGSRRDHSEFVAAAQARVTVPDPTAGGAGDGTQGIADPGGASGETGTVPADGGASTSSNRAAVSGGGSGVTGRATGGGSSGSGSTSGGSAATPGSGTGAGRGGTEPGAAGATATTVPQTALTPIKIGQVSTLSGPVGSNLKNSLKAVQSWVAWINSRGGLNGHRIEFVFAEDGSDPSRNKAAVQELVEQRGVMAFLHNTAPLSGQASVAYLQQKQIPVIGSEGGSGWMNTNSMYFPQMSSHTYLGYSFAGAVAEQLLAQGKKNVALIRCVESQDGCNSTVNTKAFEEFGLDVVYEANVSLASPDFTAQCLGARNAGAHLVFVGLDNGSVLRVADSCSNVGYKPLYSHPSQVVGDNELKNPNLEGAIVGNQTAPWFLDSLPAIAEMRTVMARYAPNVPVDAPATYGWISAKLMELATRNLSEPPTSQSVLEGLWSIRNNDLGGLTYPISFEKGKDNNAGSAKACWWAVVIKGGQWTAPNGATRKCR
jgi:branched-chain amino acid transport system substrate-binding protein